jgi:lincosamide nucleotidyltransferase A/C/D/E
MRSSAGKRAHDDLDVVIGLHHVEPAQQVLGAFHFALTVDELPTRFVLCDDYERRIDFHPVTFDIEGGGVQHLQDGSRFRYPPEGFGGTGSIDGRSVRCLTAEVQMLCHTGYVPDENDEHDMQLLHKQFGLVLPPGYGQGSVPQV